MEAKDFNAKPEGLSVDGERAYEVIMRLLKEHRATETGGCTTFYEPKFWTEERGENYGHGSVLIVVYDGGAVGPYFSLDNDYPKYHRYECMRKALADAGFYFDECTCWYAAVYRDS